MDKIEKHIKTLDDLYIYRALSNSPEGFYEHKLFEPIVFFELSEDLYSFIEENIDRPFFVRKEIEDKKLKKLTIPQQVYLLAKTLLKFKSERLFKDSPFDFKSSPKEQIIFDDLCNLYFNISIEAIKNKVIDMKQFDECLPRHSSLRWNTHLLARDNDDNTKIIENKIDKPIEKIKLNLNQTQIVYLFEQLISEGYINANHNDKLWHLISLYFTDKDNKELKSIHQTKSNLHNKGTGKPKKESEKIDKIVTSIKAKKP